MTIIALSIAILLLAFGIWRFYANMQKELVAARIAVGNLQIRMAEMEAIFKQRNLAEPRPPVNTPEDAAMDLAIDSACAAGQTYQNRRSAAEQWSQLTGKPFKGSIAPRKAV